MIDETGKGTYLLHLYAGKAATVTIGKLGTFSLSTGWYVYVGSAFGSGGLRARLKHHLSPVYRPHWHIDYLRAVADVQRVWYTVDSTRYEHEWARILLAWPNASTPMPRFGASDCRCESHLVQLSQPLDIAIFQTHTPAKLVCWEKNNTGER